MSVAVTGSEVARETGEPTSVALPTCDNSLGNNSVSLGLGLGVALPLFIALTASLVVLRRAQVKLIELEHQKY